MIAQAAPADPLYPHDANALSKMSPEERDRFTLFMHELDAEHGRRGAPYGDGSLWQLTGASSRLDYFFMAYDAPAALAEDLSHVDE